MVDYSSFCPSRKPPASTGVALIYRDEEFARVLSKLGRRTGKGNRWSQSPVAYVRNKYAINPPYGATHDGSMLTLAQATQHSGVSDTTLSKLIQKNILAVEQIASYALLESGAPTWTVSPYWAY